MLLHVLVVVFLLVLALCAALNLATLPGNWLMAVLVVLWAVFGPESRMGVLYFVAFFGLAAAGEVVEFLSQIRGSKKYGSSNASTVAGMIGAIAGAIVFAPFLFGVGAIFGALGGAWAGCFVSERLLEGRPTPQAVTSANGALMGKFLGMVVKFGLGIAMVVLTAASVWPA